MFMMNLHVKIFGVGSSSDRAMREGVEKAAEELGIDIDIEDVTDIGAIMKEGVQAIPALAIGDEILVYGKVPSIAELKRLLRA